MATLSWEEIDDRVAEFKKKWAAEKGKERQQDQNFVRDFLSCFGVDDPMMDGGEFQHTCPKDVGTGGYSDYFLPKKITIEMKSKDKNLKEAYEQLKNYVIHLPADEMPELMLVSDFDRFELYHRTTAEHISFKLKDLRKYIRHFAVIAGYETQRIYDEQLEVNIQAAMKMARIHDALKEFGYEGHELEVYLVRLLFCMFAEDTGIFPKDAFLNYNENSKANGSDLSERMGKLFEILDMAPNRRVKHSLLSADLQQFAYVDGGLFHELLHTPEFNEKMRQTLIDCCKFDWSKISPAIFGSMFQGIMEPVERREIGAHYTSEENILKVINPLFMDDLWAEFERVKSTPKKLEAFHQKISSLRILDPACGCGNFLITTYKELRRLELEIIKMKYPSRQRLLDVSPLIKVSIEQFYGIEILEFPCEVARTGMWLVEHLMNREVGEWFGMAYADLPLKRSAHIYCQNALRLDWQDLLKDDKDYNPETKSLDLKFDYIIGNPPYVGKKEQKSNQKDDIRYVLGTNWKNSGNLDYVTAWYKKSFDMMDNCPNLRAGFVSTNSITQGEQVPDTWKPLFSKGMQFDFAYRTFKWTNEGRGKAAVHCVIIGFSKYNNCLIKHRVIYDSNGKSMIVKRINPYLVDADTIFISSRKKAINNVPEMKYGSMPIDNGNLIIETTNEYNELINNNPENAQLIRKYIGGDELINNYNRWCLWLVDISPTQILKSKMIMNRIKANKEFRTYSSRPQTKKLAGTPGLFGEIRQPDCQMLVIPKVSSETRDYLPMAFVLPEVIVNGSALIIPGANLYHFGILSSCIHMAWMRAVCGRMKSDYQYSKDVVYNNFPWPELNGADGIGSARIKSKEPLETYKQRMEAKISLCAEEILRTRDNHPNSSLADLYDPLTMPADLFKAHKALDKAVMELYGYAPDMSEPEIVADLMVRYQKLVEEENNLIATKTKSKKSHSK